MSVKSLFQDRNHFLNALWEILRKFGVLGGEIKIKIKQETVLIVFRLLDTLCEEYNEAKYMALLHLGLVSSNRIALNTSRDCPLSEHSNPPPLRLLGDNGRR